MLWKKHQRTDRQAFAIALLVSLAQARLPVLLKAQNEPTTDHICPKKECEQSHYLCTIDRRVAIF
jgi:hypothetical protein